MRVTAVVMAILSFIHVGAVAAPVQCVRLSPEIVCTSSEDCYNTSDCGATCGGTSVALVGRCAATSGTEDVTVVTDIYTSTNLDDNIYCWCAMVRPFVTKWIMRYTAPYAGYCSYFCARGCRNGLIFDMGTDGGFRDLLYKNPL